MNNEVINFGCRLNAYEAEVITRNAKIANLQDTVIFNSCAVTSEAERQLRQAIRRVKKENPLKKIIVTGCAAQIHPQEYANMNEVDFVLGNQEKLEAENYHFGEASQKAIVNDIMSLEETAAHMVESFDGYARAFVQVQNGCNHRCTFCIIPYGRGNSRSVPLGDIVKQTRMLLEKGYNEIVLTGVDISDYGKDLPGEPGLGSMIKRLFKLVPEIPRLRLSSIDAVEVDNDLLDLLANDKRLMPYLHVSLQAGDDMILKRMKRRHLRDDIYKFVEKVREFRADIVLGADIIAGFPTETDEMFENTKSFTEELELTYMHVFPYSQRSGTPAAKMPQVPGKIRKERAKILREIGAKNLQKYLASRVGVKESVIVEKNNIGRTEGFAQVQLQGDCKIGSLREVSIKSSDEKYLYV